MLLQGNLFWWKICTQLLAACSHCAASNEVSVQVASSEAVVVGSCSDGEFKNSNMHIAGGEKNMG